MVVFILLLFIAALKAEDETTQYLLQYGYLENTTDALTLTAVGLKKFQENYELPADGTLNQETLDLMHRPRCGVADIGEFSVKPNKWSRTNLTWNIYPPSYSLYPYKRAADRAFKLWEAESNLRFTYDLKHPDITISFNKGEHTMKKSPGNCGYKFGPGVLGHAYSPHYDQNTEIHINADITWSTAKTTSYGEMDLFAILVHEIGHTLGIGHSADYTSIMYPFYHNFSGQLANDDIFAVQSLYGIPQSTVKNPITQKNPATQSVTVHPSTKKYVTTSTDSYIAERLPQTPVQEPTSEKSPDLCDLNFKTINTFLVVRNKLYIFYQKYAWMFNLKTKKIQSEPFLITDWLAFLPKDFEKITAIYERPNSEIVVVVRDIIYFFEYGSFKLLRRENVGDLAHTSTPSHVHAIVNTNKGKTYLFVDKYMVWSLDECSFRPIETHIISELFMGAPAQIDGVFRYTNGRLYFIKDDMFFEYNEFLERVENMGQMNLNFFGIQCPNLSILEQLKLLLVNLNNCKILNQE